MANLGASLRKRDANVCALQDKKCAISGDGKKKHFNNGLTTLSLN
jgi:hypothetical protein